MDDPALPPPAEPTPAKESFWNPLPAPGEIPPAERQMAMITHVSALSGLITGGLGFILGPLIVWQLKKNEMPSLDSVGKESLNFNISLFIYMTVSGLLSLICIGIIGVVVFSLAWIILPILAGLKANEGVYYRYPLTIRFLK